MVKFAYNKDTLILFLGKPVFVSPSDKRYKKAIKGLEDKVTEEEMKAILFDPEVHDSKVEEKYVEEVRKSGVNVEFKDGQVLLDGKVLHNSIASRVKDFAANDLPFEHLLKFIANIQDNPSYQSQHELYDFLEHKDLPITEDGYLLAYKRVTDNYLDHHTRTVDNKIGADIPRMKRSDVDDDRNKGCSKGYHAGSIQYVKGFNTGPIMIVKIHPADVVSVPKDSSCQKIRLCWYQVIGEMEEVFDQPLYTDEAKPVVNSYSANWDAIDANYQDEYDEEYEEDYDDESDVEEDYSYEDDYDNEDELDWEDDEDEEEEPQDYVGNLDEDEPEYPEPKDIL